MSSAMLQATRQEPSPAWPLGVSREWAVAGNALKLVVLRMVLVLELQQNPQNDTNTQ